MKPIGIETELKMLKGNFISYLEFISIHLDQKIIKIGIIYD